MRPVIVSFILQNVIYVLSDENGPVTFETVDAAGYWIQEAIESGNAALKAASRIVMTDVDTAELYAYN